MINCDLKHYKTKVYKRKLTNVEDMLKRDELYLA